MSANDNSKLKEYKLLISHVGKDSELALKIVDAIMEKSVETKVSDNFIITPIFMESKTNGCVGDFMEWSGNAVKASHGVLAIITDHTLEEKVLDSGEKGNDKVVYDEISLARDCLRDIIIFQNKKTKLSIALEMMITRMKKDYFDVNGKDLDMKIEEALNDVVIHARHRFAGNPLLEYAGEEQTSIDNSRTNIEDTSRYLGRIDEINQIEQHFTENKNIVCITGFGGIGKTTLAKMYAKAHPEVEVCIIYCSTEEKDLRNPVINIPMEHEIPDFDRMTIEEKFFTRLKQLEKINKKTLIIIDNFDADFSTYENRDAITYLSNLSNKSCKFLVSSRREPERVEVGIVNVGKLSDDELFELFYRDSKCKRTKENDKAIQKLIEITYGHTMTIELSARAVGDNENDITPQEMVENLMSATTDVTTNLIDRHNQFGNYERVFDHLKALFALSKVTDSQKHLLGGLSFVCRRGLTKAELKENIEYNKEDLRRLLSLGYISKVKGEDVCYFLHPLMSELCFAEFVKSDEAYEKIIKYIVYEKTQWTLNDTICELELKFDYAEHIHSRLSKLKEAGLLHSLDLLAAINCNLGRIAQAKGDIVEAEAYYKQFYEICKELAEETGTVDARRNLSISLNDLGRIAQANGDIDGAESYYKQSYEISKELAEETGTVEARRNLSISLEKLGCIAQTKGNITEAEAYYKQSYESLKELAEETGTVESRRDLSVSLSNLGRIAQAKGDIVEAEAYYKQFYEICKELAEETGTVDARRNLSISLNDLGRIAQANGDIDGAEAYYKQSYEISKELAEETGTVEARRNLSISLEKLGCIAQANRSIDSAEAYYKQSYEIRKELAEETGTVEARRDLSISLENLGRIAQANGDIDGAESYYKQSYEIRKELAEETGTVEARRDISVSLNNLGRIAQANGDIDGAEAYYKQSYEIDKELAEETETVEARRDLSVSLNNLGCTAEVNGDMDGAEAYYKQSYEIAKKLAEETGTVKALDDFCCSCLKMTTISKSQEEKLAYFQEAQGVAKLLYDHKWDFNNRYEAVLGELADYYYELGDIEKAFDIYMLLKKIESDKK